MAPVKPAPGQLPLAEFGSPERSSDPLFFAVMPDPTAARRIAALAEELRREHALHGAALGPERFHVSLLLLRFVDRLHGPPRWVVTAASRAAAGISMPAFDVRFNGVCSFGRGQNGRPLVLRGNDGLSSLHALQQTLNERLRVEGVTPRGRSTFNPHITLLYDDRVVVPQAVDPITWTVREFALIHSLFGRTEYRFLGRWPLRS